MIRRCVRTLTSLVAFFAALVMAVCATLWSWMRGVKCLVRGHRFTSPPWKRWGRDGSAMKFDWRQHCARCTRDVKVPTPPSYAQTGRWVGQEQETR